MTTFAAELVTPHAIDTTLSIAQNLISNGNDVFISDDNLITVTNVLTGEAGTATDITSNERGTAAGDYRVGYSLTGMTTLEQDSLNADPYQIFRTAEDVVNDYGLKLTTATETLTVSGLVGSWTGTEYDADDTTAAISGTGDYTVNGTTERHLKRVDITDDNGLHVIDLNRTTGNPVDLTGGLTCTLAGFPTESGYVYENGEIVGFALNDASQIITLAMTGAYTGEITYSDTTTAAISGNGNHALDGTTPVVITRVTATDTVNSFDWDFTTGDSNEIIELLQGNDAATPTKTSGWMPIVEKQVFTIRASGGDYTNFSSAFVAQAKDLVSANEMQEFLFFNDWPLGLDDNSAMVGYTTGPANWILLTVPESERFVGTDATTGFYIKNTNSNNAIRPVPGVEHLHIKGLAFKDSNGTFSINNGGGDESIVEHCLFEDSGQQTPGLNGILRNNYVIGASTDGIRVVSSGNPSVHNNIVVNSGARGIVTTVGSIFNNVFYGNVGADISNQGGSHYNNISEDGTGGSTLVDFTANGGAFVDG